MTGRDDEFDDFLRRRKPLFRRADEDGLEPPEELDRIVLRQAREAIEPERPQRVFRGPRWGAPIALAATLLVALSVVFHVGVAEKAPQGEVTVRSVAREVTAPAAAADSVAVPRPDHPAPAAAPLLEEAADNGPYVVDLVPQPAPSATAPSPVLASRAENARYSGPSVVPTARTTISGPNMAKTHGPGQVGADLPAWRRDSATWLAEIERLRAAGETARADAELAEYNRQNRAYAGAPDR